MMIMWSRIFVWYYRGTVSKSVVLVHAVSQVDLANRMHQRTVVVIIVIYELVPYMYLGTKMY